MFRIFAKSGGVEGGISVKETKCEFCMIDCPKVKSLKDRLEKAEMERDVAVKYIRHYGWCAGCKHFRGVRGCAGPGMKNCTEQNDHYEFGQKEE